MAAQPIPGDLSEWTETAPNVWERTGHPESGIITLTPPLTFPQYYAQRQLPTQGEILMALLPVIELRDVLATQDGPEIDAWCDDNANSLPEIRAMLKTLLKLLAVRL